MMEPNSSYGGGTTNVSRLFDLYRESVGDETDNAGLKAVFLKIYIDGIGTTAGKPDSTVALALGVGSTGVNDKVDQAFTKKIPKIMGEFFSLNPSIQIENVVFDVFGFSRGAAAARHFVNQVKLKQRGPLAVSIAPGKVPLVSDFDWQTAIRAGFVGLFDTVPSIGNLADRFDVTDARQSSLKLALSADAADKVVHLTARDEQRANFTLMKVSPEHEEIALPGVHSDIGGGYTTGIEGPLYLTRPVGYDEPVFRFRSATYRAKDENSRAWKEANAARESWIAKLGVPEHAITIETWTIMRVVQRSNIGVLREATPRVYAAVVLNREMDHRYALIPLRIMHEKALEAGVPLDVIDSNDPAYILPLELQPVADALANGAALSGEQEALLRRKYIHQSANWTPTHRHATAPELIFINRPAPSGVRSGHINRDG
jgi:hypothetical protein